MTTRKPARRPARPAAPARSRSALAPVLEPAAAAAVSSPRVKIKAPPQLAVVKAALEEMKAVDARVLDVRGMTDIADYMVIASGTSDRHVRSIADRVRQQVKASGVRPFGVEGANEGEWVLVDLPDVMVHVMLPRVREFYALEQLWEAPAPKPARKPAPNKLASKRAPKTARAASAAKSPRRATGKRAAAPRKPKGAGPGGPGRRPARAG